ncbi:putative ribonuclease H protein [Tripterygium wilfordii]|uniref:Putative ribonuclease H protein n=1 Tax=Tripterygium wilfordii TaxID=458696 RepID=A0A7J7CE94_TRIWF|nr:putative ribonuclease H protein [Tripterygium wilfordii]
MGWSSRIPNWDAAVEARSKRTGLWVVFRNDGGDVVACSTLLRQTCIESTLAEALGALQAVQLAGDLRSNHLLLEGDSAIIVDAIRGGESHLTAWRSVVMEIRRLLLRFVS